MAAARPTLDEAIENAAAGAVAGSGGAIRRVVVQPHLLFRGHVEEQVTAAVVRARQAHPGVEWVQVPRLGAGPLVALNTIMADSLDKLADDLAAALKKNSDFNSALQSVLKDILTKHGRVIFNGNGYSEEWHKEAAKRGLKNLRTTPDALPEIVAKSSVEVFERQGVLSKAELESREEIYTHSYVLTVNTESKLVSDIAKTLLLPAALKFAADLTPVEKTKSGGKLRKEVIGLADELASAIDALDAARDVSKSDTHAQAKHSCDKVLPAMLKVRPRPRAEPPGSALFVVRAPRLPAKAEGPSR
ncbi:MAG: hypothetical protein EBR83_07175 [Verrucomicrobia bacterium]|nr:hypothetical protein [Verrucomicrobiota bacterium]